MSLKISAFFVLTFISVTLASDLVLNIEPRAPKKPTELSAHNHKRIDSYYWLKDKQDPAVIDYLKQENNYAQILMRDTEQLQEKLYQEMRKRIKEDDESVPFKMRSYYYFARVKAGEEYPSYWRKQGVNGQEEQMLNVSEMAKGQSYFRVTYPKIHPDEKIIAYAVDTLGNRVYNIFFKDLATGKVLDYKIENVTSNMAWSETGRILYYAAQDPKTLRAHKIFKFNLDTNQHSLVYEEKDEVFEVHVSKSLSRKFLYINISSTLTSEVRFAPADAVEPVFEVFYPRERKLEYGIEDSGNGFIVHTNFKAKNFRIMKAAYRATSKKQWKEIIPHNSKVFIEDVNAFKDFMVVTKRQNGLVRFSIIKYHENKEELIKFPDPAYFVYLDDNGEFETTRLRYSFQSLNRPVSVYDYDVFKKKATLLKEEEVPTFSSSDYQSERLMATARDGARIPISLVYKKTFKKNKTAPLYITGYGAYGYSNDAYFNANIISLLDRGFVYAIAHVRGGSELGRKWYEYGKFLKKKNTFKDFIDATGFLVKERYADPKKLYANGGSAGGLLMGAVINLEPTLFHGVVAEVPFVDVVTTMLDSSLPLTTGEYEEWGNPNELRYYRYMLSYSPYDNVKKQDYPNLLVATGLNDSQVSYWEPAKWVAKLREHRTDRKKLLMLKTDMEVGHGGKSGRFEYLRNDAFSMAFVLKLAGIKE